MLWICDLCECLLASFIMSQTRVAAVFVFISFTSLLSIAGTPALMKEIEVLLIAMHKILISAGLVVCEDVIMCK